MEEKHTKYIKVNYFYDKKSKKIILKDIIIIFSF